MNQRTDEWREARAGHITASGIGELLSEARNKADRESGALSKSAESYLLERLGEILTGKPVPEFTSAATDWGNEKEPLARAAYEEYSGNSVDVVGFIHSREMPHVGCSPDGLVGDDGLVEIKCPYTTREHLRAALSREVPAEYVPQVQCQLWVTGRAWCDFVSYDPRIEYEGLGLIVIRMNRDEEYIERLRAVCRRGVKWLEDQIQHLREVYGNGETETGNA